MEEVSLSFPVEPERLYPMLASQLRALTGGVPHRTANLANASALLWMALRDINWVGFYLMEKGRLVLGPFQGKPACIEIEVGKGVCGEAVAQNRVMLVPNVHDFPGHIACDSASNAEVVIPLRKDGQVAAVLDIDSPTTGRFTQADADGLELLVPILEGIL